LRPFQKFFRLLNKKLYGRKKQRYSQLVKTSKLKQGEYPPYFSKIKLIISKKLTAK